MGEVDPEIQRNQGRHKLEVIEAVKWNTEDVIEWLSFLRDTDGARLNDKYAPAFRENDVDGKTLLELDDNGLKVIGIKSLGKRLKVLKEVAKLKKNKSLFICCMLLCSLVVVSCSSCYSSCNCSCCYSSSCCCCCWENDGCCSGKFFFCDNHCKVVIVVISCCCTRFIQY